MPPAGTRRALGIKGHKLKKLGIIGGTSWASTALYYEQINRGIADMEDREVGRVRDRRRCLVQRVGGYQQPFRAAGFQSGGGLYHHAAYAVPILGLLLIGEGREI